MAVTLRLYSDFVSVPTFFIGDEEVVGCQPYEVLAAAAERAGAKRRVPPP